LEKNQLARVMCSHRVMWRGLSALALLAGLLSASCGGSDDTAPPTSNPPPVATLPLSTPAQRAAVDAQAVQWAAALNGSERRAKLREASSGAGYGLRSAEGDLTASAVQPSQGTAMHVWDIDVIEAGLASGAQVSLTGMAAALGASAPRADAAETARLIAASLRAAANSEQLAARTWARVIAERGRLAFVPYDLLSDSLDLSTVQFDALQFAWITQRLATELRSRADAKKPAVSGSARPTDRTRLDAASAPCTLTDSDQLILDAEAAAAGKLFERLLEFLEASEAVQFGFQLANGVLTYGKLALALMSFDGKLSIENAPVPRNEKPKDAGQNRTLTFAASLKIGNVQILNCIRPALTKLGIDASTFQDGPIKGATVDWIALDFGVNGGSNGQPASTGFVQWGSDFLTKERRQLKTDLQGISRVSVDGAPLKRPLGDCAVRVPRTAKVYVDVALKSADIVTDLLDAVGGLVSLPAEMIYRSGLGFGRSLEFTVLDWDDGNPAPLSVVDRARGLATGVCVPPVYSGTVRHVRSSDTPESKLEETTEVTINLEPAFPQTNPDVVIDYRLKSGAYTYRSETTDRVQGCRQISTAAGNMSLAAAGGGVADGVSNTSMFLFQSQPTLTYQFDRGFTITTITTVSNCNTDKVDRTTTAPASYLSWWEPTGPTYTVKEDGELLADQVTLELGSVTSTFTWSLRKQRSPGQ
jgi:hypothetical protein